MDILFYLGETKLNVLWKEAKNMILLQENTRHNTKMGNEIHKNSKSGTEYSVTCKIIGKLYLLEYVTGFANVYLKIISSIPIWYMYLKIP